MGTRLLHRSLLVLLLFCSEVQLSKCPADGLWECWKLIARESTRLLTCYNETQLHVHFQFNQTLIKEETDLTATVAHYNSSLIPYTHIFCMNKFIWGIPVVWFLGCVETENSTASEQITWETVGNVIVHLFSYNNESNEVFGCDSKMVNIQEDEHLQVNMTLSQNEMTDPPFFQTGNISISVNTSTGRQNSAFDVGSGSNEGDTIIKYSYRLLLNDSSEFMPSQETNESSLEITHNFSKEGKSLVAAEVICNITRNGSTTIYFGNHTTNISTYNPISDYRMKSVSGKKTVGSNITISVSATGRFPIIVTWKIQSNESKTDYFCNATNMTLTEKRSNGQFYCRFNSTANYKFHSHFKNIVSKRKFVYNISITKTPSNKMKVVTTSTTVVVLVVFLIIAVICAIVFVMGYISYRKYKNRATETADFTFIDLQKPSRWKMVKIQFMQLKDKLGSKRRKRVGLVQPNEDSDVDSLYGSVNPFAGHESL